MAERMGGHRFDRAVAILELVSGLGVAAYMIVLGVTAEYGGVAFFALAAVFLGILAAMSRRSWRRVREHEAPEQEAPEQEARVTTTAGDDDVVVPALSEAGRAELTRVVAVLADAGLFAPRVPDPADLEEAVADWGEPVEVGAVLAALWEAPHWRPGRLRTEDHLDALAFHDSHVEQLPETLRDHVDDLARLTDGAMTVRLDGLELVDEFPVVRTRVRLRLGDDDVVLAYVGDAKYLSTEIHVAVARALRAVDGAPRLAWFWVDQGCWIAAPGDVEELNAALGSAAPDPWTWLDEQEPMAAGTLLGPWRTDRG